MREKLQRVEHVGWNGILIVSCCEEPSNQTIQLRLYKADAVLDAEPKSVFNFSNELVKPFPIQNKTNNTLFYRHTDGQGKLPSGYRCIYFCGFYFFIESEQPMY